MPVKNKNRQSNSGYEGVITGLNDEEKKVLEDAGIGGGGIKTVAINYDNNTWDVSKVDLTKDYIINIDIGGSFVIGYKNEGYYLAYIVLNILEGNIYYVIQNLTLNFDGTFTQSEIFFEKSDNDLKISYDHGGNPTTEKIIGCPPLPTDASTKTYTLKAINGVLTWVEG